MSIIETIISKDILLVKIYSFLFYYFHFISLEYIGHNEQAQFSRILKKKETIKLSIPINVVQQHNEREKKIITCELEIYRVVTSIASTRI